MNEWTTAGVSCVDSAWRRRSVGALCGRVTGMRATKTGPQASDQEKPGGIGEGWAVEEGGARG